MVRFAYCPGFVAVVFVLSVGTAAPLVAQTEHAEARPLQDAVAASIQAHADAAETLPAVAPPRQHRPAALVPLYLSYASLQALDVHSTTRALDRGAAEVNPLMKGLGASQVGLLAAKAAGVAGVIYCSEKMWKKNRVAAVVFMVAANSGMAWVVQHNYRAVR
jgi:hypothetical protein